MFPILPKSIKCGVNWHADFKNDTQNLVKATIYMLAANVAAKVFHNLTTIWGTFTWNFKNGYKDTKIKFGVLKVDIVLYSKY